MNQRVVGLTRGQDACLGGGFGPGRGAFQRQLIVSVSHIDVSHPLCPAPFSPLSNQQACPWLKVNFKKKKLGSVRRESVRRNSDLLGPSPQIKVLNTPTAPVPEGLGAFTDFNGAIPS